MVTGITVGSLVLLLSLLAWLLGPKMKELAVKQINEYLLVPVSVNEIHFSFFRKFPYATVDFSGVRTAGSKVTGTRDPLLDAKHIFFQFSWFDLFKDDVRIKGMIIEDASCLIFTDKNGRNNYNIFKDRGSENVQSRIALESILLKNTGVRYLSVPGGKDISLLASDLNLKGIFSSVEFDLTGSGAVFAERCQIGNVNYLDQKPTELDVKIKVNTGTGLYTISESLVRIAELNLGIDGFIRNSTAGTVIDLKINSKHAGMQEMLSLIPGVYTSSLKKYEYKGNVFFDVHISGNTGKGKGALVTASFGTHHASIAPAGTSYKLDNIRFKGSYTNRISEKKPYERLALSGVNAVMEGQPVSMSLLLEDFSNPYVDLTASSKINLEVLSRFYMPDTLSEMKGDLSVDARVKGRTREPSSWISEGNVSVNRLGFKLKQNDILFTEYNGRVTLHDNRLTLTNLSGRAAGSDFIINGYFDNVYAYLLSSSEKMRGEASLSSKNLDLNELLEDKYKTEAVDTGYHLDFSDRINIRLGLQIGILSFRRFQAWQVRGHVDIRDKVLSTGDLSFKAFDGHLLLKGKIDAARNDSVLIACDADVKKLDVTELFYQMGNFGQQVIRDKNVKGKITASVQFASTWSKDLHCNLNKIYAKSKLLIENGELIEFQPMLLLSKYLKSADLNKIKFETLENEIEISNQSVIIPAMEIKSSVMDLTASGTHTFGNIVDYKLQLYLSHLLGKKVRNNNTEFGTIEDDGLGRMKLFLTMKGPLNSPVIEYDRRGMEQKIVRDIKEEKQDLKKILNKEFGWFKKDTTVVKKTDNQPKKQEELELELDEE